MSNTANQRKTPSDMPHAVQSCVEALRVRFNGKAEPASFWALAQLCGKQEVDAEFLAALTFLQGAGELALFFIYEDEIHHERIDGPEGQEALNTGQLVHPVWGRIITDFEDNLIPYVERRT